MCFDFIRRDKSFPEAIAAVADTNGFKPVIDFLPLFAGGDDAGLFEDAEVVGHGRLLHLEVGADLTDIQGLVLEQFHDPDPVGVGDGFEELIQILFHIYIEIYLCIRRRQDFSLAFAAGIGIDKILKLLRLRVKFPLTLALEKNIGNDPGEQDPFKPFPKWRWIMTRVLILTLAVALLCESLPGQQIGGPTRQDLSGPRTGITLITGKAADRVEEELDLKLPLISQFGWQFERRFFSIPEGPTGVVEFIPLIGGMENNVLLPSVSLVVGLRGVNGMEFGVGPNASISGIAYVAGGGITRTIGMLNVPLNLSIVFSQEGARFSFLVGFNSAAEP